jgi:4-hydroxy-tetrahydrodipicolinate reductase
MLRSLNRRGFVLSNEKRFLIHQPAMKMKVAQFGLGPIGVETLRLAAQKPWLEIVAGIDIDPIKVGQDLGSFCGIKSLGGRKIYGSVNDIPSRLKPDFVFHTAVSKFEQAFSQLKPLAELGISVVSSCEELLFPSLTEPRLTRVLDKICQAHGSRIVGTGVNPGFVMDVLPLCLTSVNRSVSAIHIQRVVDASTRREPLQRKIGSGLPPQAFRRLFKEGKAGHAGLKESLALIAHALNWKITNLSESGNPVVAKKFLRTKFLSVEKGATCGLHQRAEAKVNGRISLTLDLKMYLGAPDPHDAIQIEGEPPLNVIIQGGVAGDQATVAALVNTARRIHFAKPGLILMTDLTLPRFG